MLQPYTALIRQSEGWWIGWILEVRGLCLHFVSGY